MFNLWKQLNHIKVSEFEWTEGLFTEPCSSNSLEMCVCVWGGGKTGKGKRDTKEMGEEWGEGKERGGKERVR